MQAMVGERLKAARLAAGLSLRRLAEQAGVSAQAISKYERGLDVPSSGVLLRLARALGVGVEYLLRPRPVLALHPVYRCRASLGRKQERAILSHVQEWLERYLEVEDLLDKRPRFELPATLDRQVARGEDVERVALQLRAAWSLGVDAIENLVEVLEEQGIKVGLVDADERFDACTFRVEDGTPVIAVNSRTPGDRQRFNLAHELGHLVLEPASGLDAEKAAHRFAGAFLVPEPAVRQELGSSRRVLSPYELHLLKHKYGLSMQGWIHRARDLGILSEARYSELFREYTRRGWRRREPGDEIPPEEPKRLERLVFRALAEDLISPARAAELLGQPLASFLRHEAQRHGPFVEHACL